MSHTQHVLQLSCVCSSVVCGGVCADVASCVRVCVCVCVMHGTSHMMDMCMCGSVHDM